MPMAANDIYRANIRWIMDEQICYNTFHFRVGQTVPNLSVNAYMNGLLNLLEAFITGPLVNTMHESIKFTHLSLTGVLGADLFMRERNLDIDASASGTDLLPGFVAVPIYLITGFQGRSRRGRFHFGGLSESMTDGGRLTATGDSAVIEVRNGIEAIRAGVPFSWELVVWSRLIAFGKPATDDAPAVPPDPGNSFRAVEEVIRGHLPGSMYSRKIGRGQ